MNPQQQIDDLSQKLKMANLNLEHMARRMEQRLPDYDTKRFTAEVMTARDKYFQEKARREDAEKALGEALARIAMLTKMVEEAA